MVQPPKNKGRCPCRFLVSRKLHPEAIRQVGGIQFPTSKHLDRIKSEYPKSQSAQQQTRCLLLGVKLICKLCFLMWQIDSDKYFFMSVVSHRLNFCQSLESVGSVALRLPASQLGRWQPQWLDLAWALRWSDESGIQDPIQDLPESPSK